MVCRIPDLIRLTSETAVQRVAGAAPKVQWSIIEYANCQCYYVVSANLLEILMHIGVWMHTPKVLILKGIRVETKLSNVISRSSTEFVATSWVLDDLGGFAFRFKPLPSGRAKNDKR